MEQTTDDGGKMYDVCRFMTFEDLLAFCEGAQVAIRATKECPVFGLTDCLLKSFADEARNKYTYFEIIIFLK